MANCDAIDFLTYEGTVARKFPGSTAYFYVTDRMAIDADGAPNAYHPEDRGIDALANAGFPNGGWKSILAVDPHDPAKPFVQPAGPFAGFFVSKTTLQDPTRAETDPARYVDSTRVPYLVFPGAFHALAGTGTMGDLAMARNLRTGAVTAAIVADWRSPERPARRGVHHARHEPGRRERESQERQRHAAGPVSVCAVPPNPFDAEMARHD